MVTSGAASLPIRLRAGDEDALRELFRALGPQAHALAQHVVGITAAEAVVEEVFLLAWREPERWNAATFELELLRCVRDLALAVRRRGISAAAALAQLEPPAAAPGGEALTVGRENADLVRAALFALEESERELLEAAWFDGALEANDPAALTAALERLADAIRGRA